MVVEYIRYKIEKERHGTFAEAYKKAVEFLGASEHCLAYELTQCVEDPDHFTLRIEWDSEEGHLKGFRNSPEFVSFFALVRPYLKDMEEMRHYTVIKVGRRRSTASAA